MLLAAVVTVSDAFGQQVVTLEFSFSNPGARSLGFGGAFAALADDATASYVNPAGLIQLVEPEVSLEGRSWSYTTPFTVGGRAQGVPTGIGLDTTPGLRLGESTADLRGLSFFSVAYPLGRWTLAFYSHQLAKFESAFLTDGLFADGDGFLGTARWVDRPGSSRLDIVSYGVATGYRLSDALSLGVGISYLDVEHDMEEAVYLSDDDTLEGFFAANSFLAERQVSASETHADDTGGLNAGFLWRATERWTVGGFYRFASEFDMRRQIRAGPAASPDTPLSSTITFTLHVPDVFGLGVAWRSRDERLTLSAEWDHVAYSQFIGAASTTEAITDVDELHLGSEYIFLRSTPVVALRLGVWLDPDHRLRAINAGPLFEAILQPGDDQIHYAAGVGLAFETFRSISASTCRISSTRFRLRPSTVSEAPLAVCTVFSSQRGGAS